MQLCCNNLVKARSLLLKEKSFCKISKQYFLENNNTQLKIKYTVNTVKNYLREYGKT